MDGIKYLTNYTGSLMNKVIFNGDNRNEYTHVIFIDQLGNINNSFGGFLDQPNATFDEIISYSFINILCRNQESLERALSKVKDVLKPFGKVIFAFIDPVNFASYIDKSQINLEQIHNFIFVHAKIGGFISLNNLLKIVKKVGFSVDFIGESDLFTTIELSKPESK